MAKRRTKTISLVFGIILSALSTAAGGLSLAENPWPFDFIAAAVTIERIDAFQARNGRLPSNLKELDPGRHAGEGRFSYYADADGVYTISIPVDAGLMLTYFSDRKAWSLEDVYEGC